jgi:hypothetical protein
MNLPYRINRGACRIRRVIQERWSPLRFRNLAYSVGWVLLLSMSAMLSVYLEYRNNWIAGWVGEALDRNNERRARTGAIWKRLDARAAARDSFGTVEAPVAGGLPKAVADARFDMDRVPETGLPSFVAVWRTELSVNASRETRELIGSASAFNLGLSLLRKAGLPDVRYRARIRRRVDALYRHAGETEWRAEADSMAIADSIRADVRERLAGDFVEQFRSEERQRLMEEYKSGLVSQILIQSGLGIYHGELVYVDPERASVRFEVEPGGIAALFGDK